MHRLQLNLKINWKYLLALLALMRCVSELHEQIHIQTGRIVCGGYGERDFNVWQLAEVCRAPQFASLATLAGPLLSYAVMWTGAFLLLKAKTLSYKTVGFSLVFAPLPFARIFTAMTGGGDEKVVLLAFLENELSLSTIKILTAVVTAICLPPLLIAWRSIANRFAASYVVGFSVLPLIFIGLLVFRFLNPFLASGFLSHAPVLGSPLLVLIQFSLMAGLLVLARKWLLEINRE